VGNAQPQRPTDPVLAVPCPTCGARAGSHCRRPSGHSGPFVAPHRTRRDAAEAAELLTRDPEPTEEPGRQLSFLEELC